VDKTPSSGWRKRDYATAAEVMPHLLAALKPPSAAWLETLRSAWAEMVGDAVAGQTTPETIEEATLVVRVKNHVWLTELRSGLGQMIHDKVNAKFPGIIKRINWVT
jgi:predicted nucleic acid-binding Zn ribbon protein